MHLNTIQKKDLLLDAVGRCQKIYNFDLNGFAIYGNYFYLIIKTHEGEANISRIMQYVKARFAENYNKLTGRKGPFWNERFKDQIIEHSDDPEYLFNYMKWHMGYNSAYDGYFKDPREYRFCSINAYLNDNYKSKVKITLHEFFLNLGKTFHERVEKFLLFEEEYRKRIYNF